MIEDLLKEITELLKNSKPVTEEITLENGDSLSYSINPEGFSYSYTVKEKSTKMHDEFVAYIANLEEWIYDQAIEMFAQRSSISLAEFTSMIEDCPQLEESINLFKDCVRAVVIDEIISLSEKYDIDIKNI